MKKGILRRSQELEKIQNENLDNSIKKGKIKHPKYLSN